MPEYTDKKDSNNSYPFLLKIPIHYNGDKALFD